MNLVDPSMMLSVSEKMIMYESNYLQPNPDQWHLLLNVAREDLTVSVGNKCVPNTSFEKF